MATEVRIFSGFEGLVLFVFDGVSTFIDDGGDVVDGMAVAIWVVGTACKNPFELSITMYCSCCGTEVVTELFIATDVVWTLWLIFVESSDTWTMR